jgi:hypothetical protein
MKEAKSGGRLDESVDTGGKGVLFLLILLDCIALIIISGYSHSRSEDMQCEHIGRRSSHHVSLGTCLNNNGCWVLFTLMWRRLHSIQPCRDFSCVLRGICTVMFYHERVAEPS